MNHSGTFLEELSSRRRALGAGPGQRGMTLLEIMIVLAILALVMGFLIGPKVISMFGKARSDTAKLMAKEFAEDAYTRWSIDNPGKCPESIEPLLKYTNSKDGKDPWGKEFRILCGPNKPAGVNIGIGVASDGEDQKPDTEDDVRSWR